MQAPIGPSQYVRLHWTARHDVHWIIWCGLIAVLCVAVQQVAAGPRYSSRIVETKTGAIRGVILELDSRHLEPVEVFKAVPYAAPPVGAQRFEQPLALPPWKGTKLADTFGAVCPQVRIRDSIP